MAFKFFNIGKANAEIERLETELSSSKSESESLKSNGPEVEAAAEGLRTELATTTASLATLQNDLSEARADVARLTSELSAEKEKSKNIPDQVKASASAQAAAIVAGVGHAPLSLAPTGGEVTTMTRAEFLKLSAKEKSSFAQKGGRLTD